MTGAQIESALAGHGPDDDTGSDERRHCPEVQRVSEGGYGEDDDVRSRYDVLGPVADAHRPPDLVLATVVDASYSFVGDGIANPIRLSREGCKYGYVAIGTGSDVRRQYVYGIPATAQQDLLVAGVFVDVVVGG